MAYREDYSSPARGGTLGGNTDRVPVEAKSAPQPETTAAAAAVVQPPSASADEHKPSGSRKKFVLAAVLLAALGFGGYEGYGWWTNGRFMVTTDDAYVQADITTLAAKVSGYVENVEVVNNQSVRAGDVIARIDAGDYRLAVQSARHKLNTQASTIARIGRQVEAAQASVAQAAAQVDAAKADAQRAASGLRAPASTRPVGFRLEGASRTGKGRP